jgi:hypothetical protein
MPIKHEFLPKNTEGLQSLKCLLKDFIYFSSKAKRVNHENDWRMATARRRFELSGKTAPCRKRVSMNATQGLLWLYGPKQAPGHSRTLAVPSALIELQSVLLTTSSCIYYVSLPKCLRINKSTLVLKNKRTHKIILSIIFFSFIFK